LVVTFLFSVTVSFLSSSHPTSNANGTLMPLHYLLVLLLQFVQFECIQTSFVGVIVMIPWLFLWHTYSWSYAAAFINWFHALYCVSVALLCMHIHFDDPYAFCYIFNDYLITLFPTTIMIDLLCDSTYFSCIFH
jgi:hypothetical protein